MADITNAEVMTDDIIENSTPEVDEFDGWDDESNSTDEWDEAESEENGSVDNEEANTEETVTEETKPSAEESVEAEESKEEPKEEPKETYQFLETKYNKETVKFDLGNPEEKEKVIRFIQKGQNYDKVVAERDTLKANDAKLKYLENSLETIKGNFNSVYDLLDDALAESLVKSEADNGRELKKDEALKRVIANRESVFKEATPPSTDSLRQDGITEFVKVYPNVKPDEIPQTVWEEFNETFDLISAYRTYKNGQKETEFAELQKKYDSVSAELEQLKLNEKNRIRSTGSQKTSGKAPLADPEFEGWND